MEAVQKQIKSVQTELSQVTIPTGPFLAAVFWMSRNALGGALRDIQKTAARETILGGTSLVEVEVPQAPLQPPEPESRILPRALRDALASGCE